MEGTQYNSTEMIIATNITAEMIQHYNHCNNNFTYLKLDCDAQNHLLMLLILFLFFLSYYQLT